MTQTTLFKIDEIINFMESMNATDLAMPLRLCDTGFDLYKIPGMKEYSRMTIGEFLKKIVSFEKIPRPLIRLADAIMSTKSNAEPQQTVAEVNKLRLLPTNTEVSFLEQAEEVIYTLLTQMALVNNKYDKIANRLSLGYNKGMNDDQIAEIESCTRERIRQIRCKFLSDLLEGSVPQELSEEYGIKDTFISLAHRTISGIENQEISIVRKNCQNLSNGKVKFIASMLGLKIIEFDGGQFFISHGNTNELTYIAQQVKIQLRKEYDYVPVSKLIPNNNSAATTFLKAYFKSKPEVYEFTANKKAIRMKGTELNKAARVARIIFEAGEWISKTDIAIRYKELYHENLGALDICYLNRMGFKHLGNTGKWKFGAVSTDIQRLIREIITPDRPLVTFNTIVKEVEKLGLEYPHSTIRTYITDIATPENKQNDLFCLKGYCHLYPNYSWRRFRKIGA